MKKVNIEDMTDCFPGVSPEELPKEMPKTPWIK